MGDAWVRVTTLARKDWEEVRRQPGLLLPAVAMVVGLSLPALFVLLIVPRITGESLADAGFAQAADTLRAQLPGLARLTVEGQAQAFVLQQFLVFGLMVPVLGSISLAAQAIVGEKQARSLEPLLTTPITVPELLLAKVLTPFVLAMCLLMALFGLFLLAMALFGEPDVWRTLLWGRTLLLYGVIAPLMSLTALLTAAIMSSRVNDARTAQQLGGLLTLPVTALFVAQFSGQFLIGPRALMVSAVVLVGVNALLLWQGVRVFQRETILMRWK